MLGMDSSSTGVPCLSQVFTLIPTFIVIIIIIIIIIIIYLRQAFVLFWATSTRFALLVMSTLGFTPTIDRSGC